ncbi:MAG TPA: response regulator, partial [Verrucomicrobiae bacterium]|nr:response regulator [Verrucomicrobiae bacterium]
FLDHPRPSLVLLDYDLGARCGTDFLYWLRILHRNSAIPVVMYTGSAGGHNIVECYAKGANHFLRKPQSFTRVEAIVRTLRACFSAPTPSLNFLASLPESQPDPRGVQSVSA